MFVGSEAATENKFETHATQLIYSYRSGLTNWILSVTAYESTQILHVIINQIL